MATILDVIDNFWGSDPLRLIARADSRELRRFGHEVNRFYKSYVITEPKEKEFRTYFGGLAAANFSLAVQSPNFFNALLYANSTVIPEPLAQWYFEEIDNVPATPPAIYANGMQVDQSEKIGWFTQHFKSFKDNLEARREILIYYVGGLLSISPLIRAGIVVPISQAQIVQQHGKELVAAALRDANCIEYADVCESPPDELHPVWDNIRGTVLWPENFVRDRDPLVMRWARSKEAGFHINKNLVIANESSATYIPTNDTDSRLLVQSIKNGAQALQADRFEIFGTSSASQLMIPGLEGLSPADFASIRLNEEAFSEFRKHLAELFLTHPQSSIEAAELASKALGEEIRRIREKLKDSKVIKDAIREEGINLWMPLVLIAIDPSKLKASAAAITILGKLLHRLRTRFKDTNEVILRLATFKRTETATIPKHGGLVEGLPRAFGQIFLGKVTTGPPPAGADPTKSNTAINVTKWTRRVY